MGAWRGLERFGEVWGSLTCCWCCCRASSSALLRLPTSCSARSSWALGAALCSRMLLCLLASFFSTSICPGGVRIGTGRRPALSPSPCRSQKTPPKKKPNSALQGGTPVRHDGHESLLPRRIWGAAPPLPTL